MVGFFRSERKVQRTNRATHSLTIRLDCLDEGNVVFNSSAPRATALAAFAMAATLALTGCSSDTGNKDDDCRRDSSLSQLDQSSGVDAIAFEAITNGGTSSNGGTTGKVTTIGGTTGNTSGNNGGSSDGGTSSGVTGSTSGGVKSPKDKLKDGSKKHKRPKVDDAPFEEELPLEEEAPVEEPETEFSEDVPSEPDIVTPEQNTPLPTNTCDDRT